MCPVYLHSIAFFQEHLLTAFQCFLVKRIFRHTALFCILECLQNFFALVISITK